MARIFKLPFSRRRPRIVRQPRIRIFGYGEHGPKRKERRALLSYLPEPLLAQIEGDQIKHFSNLGLAVSIPRALNELGYLVDIISWEDTDFRPRSDYDLFIAHGAHNFDQIDQALRPTAARIYFSTGAYWRFNNEAGQARAEALKRRRGFTLDPGRLITESEDSAHRRSHGIINLGGANVLTTYPNDLPPVYSVDTAVFPDPRDGSEYRDYTTAAQSFLFLAGAGNVHKGLDLILEAFADSPLQLYIATHLEPAFAQAYHDILSQPNIHNLGYVPIRSPEYYQALDVCGFIISATCSEGGPGGVLEAMNQGLVPLLTEANNVDVAPFGFTIAPTVGSVKEVVQRAASLSSDELWQRSRQARHITEQVYTPVNFRNHFKEHVQTIVGP